MSQPLGQHDFDLLLEQLEQRILAQADLLAEYEQAHEDFLAGSTADAATRLRFREWFLIERDCSILGAPPAVAWAPDDLQDPDIWQRLLESFFGIFFAVEGEGSGCPILEDLWSGRQIRLDRPLPSHDDNLIIVGRCAQGSADSHVLLPSVLFLAADNLRDALAEDLSRIRAEQPRGRLSQRQCEHLLLPFRQESCAAPQAEDVLLALDQALMGKSNWTSDRLLDLAQEHGITEALNVLAFKTEVDLEPVRAALTTLQAISTQPNPAALQQETDSDLSDTLSPSEVEAVLADFESARLSGKSIADSFEFLEQRLGLPIGGSEPFADVSQEVETDREPTGPAEIPSVSMWMATYLWEQEAVGITIKEADAREIGSFLEHLQSTRGTTLDPEGVAAGDLLGYMLRSADLKTLDSRLKSLKPFLNWLALEQGAQLADTLGTLEQSTGELLRSVVTVNHQLEQQSAAKDAIAWVKSTVPLKVGAENAELVEVAGIPDVDNFVPSVGDCLMGRWRSGKFYLGAWLPLQFLPNREAATE